MRKRGLLSILKCLSLFLVFTEPLSVMQIRLSSLDKSEHSIRQASVCSDSCTRTACPYCKVMPTQFFLKKLCAEKGAYYISFIPVWTCIDVRSMNDITSSLLQQAAKMKDTTVLKWYILFIQKYCTHSNPVHYHSKDWNHLLYFISLFNNRQCCLKYLKLHTRRYLKCFI